MTYRLKAKMTMSKDVIAVKDGWMSWTVVWLDELLDRLAVCAELDISAENG